MGRFPLSILTVAMTFAVWVCGPQAGATGSANADPSDAFLGTDSVTPGPIELAQTACREKKWNEALKQCDLALKDDPKNGPLMLLRGFVLFQLKDYAKAEESENAGMKLNVPPVAIANAKEVLAQCSKSQGRYELALTQANEALAGGYTQPDNLLLRATCNKELRHYDVALDLFAEAEKLAPKADLLYALRSQVYGARKDYAGAMAEVNRGLEAVPHSVPLQQARSDIHCAMGDRKAAMTDIQEAMKINPTANGSHLRLAKIYLFTDDYANALAETKQEQQLAPSDPMVHIVFGEIHNKKKEYDAAILECGEALKLRPDFINAICLRGTAQERQGNYQQALDEYNHALQIDPKSAEVLNAHAWLLATCLEDKFRDGQRALAEAHEANQLSEGNPNAEDTPAAAYAETGDSITPWSGRSEPWRNPTCRRSLRTRQSFA